MSGIVVLISGRGSNLQAICNSSLKQQIKCVISNKVDAPGLLFARDTGLETHVVESNQSISREDFDRKVAAIIDKHNPDIVVLAGFMLILSSWFVKHYVGRLINIHPSLLPAFAGTIHAQADALDARVKVTGATVHFVSEEVDCGAVIAQGVVHILGTDNEQSLNQRILELEHVIYPFIIHKLLSKQIAYNDNNGASVIRDPTDSQWLGKFMSQIFY